MYIHRYRNSCLYIRCMCAKSLHLRLTLWPHGLKFARLICSWDSPGKNAGVGCHALLQGIFLTQRSSLHLLWLHCQQIIYRWAIVETVYMYVYIYIYTHIYFLLDHYVKCIYFCRLSSKILKATGLCSNSPLIASIFLSYRDEGHSPCSFFRLISWLVNLFIYLAAPGLSCGTWDLCSLVVACRIFSCGMQYLFPWPGITPRSLIGSMDS